MQIFTMGLSVRLFIFSNSALYKIIYSKANVKCISTTNHMIIYFAKREMI